MNLSNRATTIGAVVVLLLLEYFLFISPWWFIASQHELRATGETAQLFPGHSKAFTVFIVLLTVYTIFFHKKPCTDKTVIPVYGKMAIIALLGLLFLKFGAGFFFRQLGVLWTESINTYKADMLPLVEIAIRTFFGEGTFPYAYHDVGGWVIYMTYPPGFWFPSAVPYFFGIDIRVLQLGALVALAFVFYGWFATQIYWSTSIAETITSIIKATIPLWILYYSPGFLNFLPQLHVGHVWLLAAIFALAVNFQYHKVSSLLLGYLAITRPYYVLLFPLWMLYIAREKEWNWKQIAIHTVLLFAPFVLLMLPFLLYDARATLLGITRIYEELSQILKDNEPEITYGFALTPVLEKIGLYKYKYLVAGIFQLIVLTIAFFRLKDERSFLLLSGLSLMSFLSVSIIPWFYIFVDPMILLIMAPTAMVPAIQTGKQRHGLLVATATALLLIVALPMAYMLIKPPTQALTHHNEESYPLFESIKTADGFGETRWWSHGRIDTSLTAQHNRLILPMHDLSDKQLSLEISGANIPEGTTLELFMNTHSLGSVILDGESAIFFAVPKGTIYRGANRIRMSIIVDDRLLTDEKLREMGMMLRSVSIEGGN